LDLSWFYRCNKVLNSRGFGDMEARVSVLEMEGDDDVANSDWSI